MKHDTWHRSNLNLIISRRSLLKVVGVSVVSASTGLLAACATDDADEEPDAAAGEQDDAGDGEDDVDEEDSEDGTDEPTESADDEASEETAEEDRYGGNLIVALIGEPVHLDIHRSTTTIVALITWHIWEPLFTWDEDFALAMDLAESYEASDDALTHVITLRQGVLFHNGEEMTAEDVVASIERWGQSGQGTGVLEATDELVVVDDYTVEFRMAEPFGVLTTFLARQNAGCAIHPRERMEAVGTDTMDHGFIGTGPFRFAERAADRFIRVERNDDYVARTEPASGYFGEKIAYVDTIEFIPVPDESARISGLRAGDYHYLENVAPDQLVALEDDPEVVAEILPPEVWNVFVMNWQSPLMGELTLRQAVQAALHHEEIAQAAFGREFFVLQPGIQHEGTTWHSLVGEDLYDRRDPDTARELLDEAGYDGAPVRLMTTQEYSYMFNGASVFAQQLEDIGMTVELDVVDWATLGERREDPEAFDIFTTGFTFRVDPIQHPWIATCNWPGWWCDDEKEELSREFRSTTDFEDRFSTFEEIQLKFYEDVGNIKIADGNALRASRSEVRGLVPFTQLREFFWNVWLDE